MEEAKLQRKSVQVSDTLLMVMPDHFGFNAQTAATNPMQHKVLNLASEKLTKKAMAEFNEMVGTLRANGIKVIILPSPTNVKAPDAIYPNNWFTTHILPSGHGLLTIYPMLTANRRVERRSELVLQQLQELNPKLVWFEFDLTNSERYGEFLEGTGSMVFDRENRVIYAAISPRTSVTLLEEFARLISFELHAFNAIDKKGAAIYHTNVMMAVGETWAVVCSESIIDKQERIRVLDSLTRGGKQVLEISLQQVNAFCGNILEVSAADNKKCIVMSETAYNNFTAEQLQILENKASFVVVAVPTIESIGGGGARCMIAELFY